MGYISHWQQLEIEPAGFPALQMSLMAVLVALNRRVFDNTSMITN
jgi:hypothetical protein